MPVFKDLVVREVPNHLLLVPPQANHHETIGGPCNRGGKPGACGLPDALGGESLR